MFNFTTNKKLEVSTQHARVILTHELITLDNKPKTGTVNGPMKVVHHFTVFDGISDLMILAYYQILGVKEGKTIWGWDGH